MNNLIKDPELTLNQIIEAFNKNTPDIFGNDQKEEARNYVHNISPSYLRTILDCTKLLKNSDSVVCELGAYLGIVSKVLKIGYEVNPYDIHHISVGKRSKNTIENQKLKFMIST